jgi:hypothetical protein
MSLPRKAVQTQTKSPISFPRKATDQEFNTLLAYGLPPDVDRNLIWLNECKTAKNLGKLYWTWKKAFLFFDKQKYSLHKAIAIGKIDPDRDPEWKQNPDSNDEPTQQKSKREREEDSDESERPSKKQKSDEDEMAEMEAMEKQIQQKKALIERKRQAKAQLDALKQEETELQSTEEDNLNN